MAQQRSFIAKEEDYIRRNLAGQNTAQAKGRRKLLARLPRLSPPPGEGDAMSLRLEIADRGGDQVLVAEKLTVAVGERVLVRDFSSSVRRGDVIALVGPERRGEVHAARDDPRRARGRRRARCASADRSPSSGSGRT